MIYVLDHYYAINHQEFCRIIEIDKKVEEIVEICSSISFLLEELFNPSESLDMDCLLEILLTYYGARNIKDTIEEEMLYQIELPIEDVYLETYIGHDYISVSKAYIIDLYEARESCCGPNYKKIMNKWLPKGKELDDLKQILLTTGLER